MKPRLLLASVAALSLAALAAGPVAAQPPTGCPGSSQLILVAMLDPLQEIVGPGDANGNGFACAPGGQPGNGAFLLIDDRD